jgi:hypothetical protein
MRVRPIFCTLRGRVSLWADYWHPTGSYPVQLERKEGQSKRVWLLMGGTDEGWTAFSEINRTSLPVP